MTEQVIAIIAAGEAKEPVEGPSAIESAMTVLRAVVERGERVLLAGEASFVVPLLMAAAEYAEPTNVETGEDGPPPSLILGPLVMTDALEDQLLDWRPKSEEGDAEPSLLDALSSARVIDVADPRPLGPEGISRRFRFVLEEYLPIAIFTVGRVVRTETLVDVAESYSRSRDDRPPLLLWLPLADGAAESRPLWRQIAPLAGDDAPPPKMDGRVLDGAEGEAGVSEELAALVRRAARDASLTLSIDRVVGEILRFP